MDIPAFLAHVPLFAGLPEQQLDGIARICVARGYARGEQVFSEGEDATGFYVVASGRVKVFKLSPDGREQVLHLIGFQEPFGEVPVFAGERFPANAQTMEESVLVFVPRLAFADLIKCDPSLAMNMLALLSRRLRQLAGLVEQLSLREVPARLASYLVYLSNREQGAALVELDIPKTLLADVLGTKPETVSRALGRMAADGLIEVDGRRIRLVDREGLDRLASGAG
jgi:CRP/FNR family transcriptional regulator